MTKPTGQCFPWVLENCSGDDVVVHGRVWHQPTKNPDVPEGLMNIDMHGAPVSVTIEERTDRTEGIVEMSGIQIGFKVPQRLVEKVEPTVQFAVDFLIDTLGTRE